LARVSASSAPNGSSISSTLGSIDSARAMPTRCFMPPEISCGYLCWRGRGRPDPLPPGARLQLLLAFLLAENALDGEIDVLEAGQPGQQAVVLENHRALRAGAGDFAAVAEQHADGRQSSGRRSG
jgi:hypothetical protein